MEEIKYNNPKPQRCQCNSCAAYITIQGDPGVLWMAKCPYCNGSLHKVYPVAPVEKVTDRCDCKEWVDNITDLEALQLHATRKGIWKYSGTPMRYCPWCGKVLKDIAKGTSY